MTVTTRLFVFLIIAASFYMGSTAAQVSTSSTQTQRGMISGVVVRAGSGEPVRKALVSLRPVNQAAVAPAAATPQQTQRGAQEAQGAQANRGQGNANRGQGNGGQGNGGGR